MNVGFREAMREEDWDCLFFHDVDLIPEDDRNTYVCDANPKHAAIAMDKFGYKWVRVPPHSVYELSSSVNLLYIYRLVVTSFCILL